MTDDIVLDYDFLMQNALRRLMRDVLNLIKDIGDAPGEHHFYIEFLTHAPGVAIPDHLLEEYPERMTIVLQHQFENLTVDDEKFGVTLWFKGKQTRLEIPFSAVTNFADPSMQFGLRFEPVEEQEGKSEENETEQSEQGEAPTPLDAKNSDAPPSKKEPSKTGESADIVSLDAFRKK